MSNDQDQGARHLHGGGCSASFVTTRTLAAEGADLAVQPADDTELLSDLACADARSRLQSVCDARQKLLTEYGRWPLRADELVGAATCRRAA